MIAYYATEWDRFASRIIGRWCPSLSGVTGLTIPNTAGGTPAVFSGLDRNTSWQTSDNKLSISLPNSGYFSIAYPAINLTAFSISFWFRSRGGNSTQAGIFSWADSAFSGGPFILLTQQLNNVTRWYVNNGYQLTTTTRQDWDHYSITYNSNVWRFFLNGSVQSTYSGGLALQSVASTIYFGSGFSSAANGFADDLILFNGALDTTEIQSIYEQGRGGGMLYQPPRRRSYFASATNRRRRVLLTAGS